MTIATIASRSGTSAPTTVPKTSRRMMSAAGRPKKSSPSFEVVAGKLEEVAVGGELARDPRLEAVAARRVARPRSRPRCCPRRSDPCRSSARPSAGPPRRGRGEERWSSMWCVTPSASMSLRRSRHLRLEGRVARRRAPASGRSRARSRTPRPAGCARRAARRPARTRGCSSPRRRSSAPRAGRRPDDADRDDESDDPQEHHAPRSSARDTRERLDPASHHRTLAVAPGAAQVSGASIW